MTFTAEDASHTTFVRLCRSHGGVVVLSRAAMHLHTFGVLSSIESDTPGFVSDTYLNAISAETSVTTLELCLAGLWQRTSGGYRVSDADTLGVVRQIHGQLHVLADRCLSAGGHRTDAGFPDACARCGSSTTEPAGTFEPRRDAA